jgi:hypothetical protein
MYTDRMTVFILKRRVYRQPRTTCGRPREFLANRTVTHISCEPTPIYADAAWRPASEHASCGCTRACTPETARARARATQGHPARWPSCGRTSVDSTNVVSACITAGRQLVCARFQTQPKLSQNANAAQKSCGEDEIGCEMVRWTVSGQGCGALTVDRTPDHN